MPRFPRSAVGLLLPLILALPALAGPDDIVPRGSVTYDFMGSLAAAGRLAGYSLSDFARGDHLYSRRQIARILAVNSASLNSDDAAFASFRRLLFSEFAPELKALGIPVPANSALPTDDAESAGSLKLRALSGPAQMSGTIRLALTSPLGRDGLLALGGGTVREEWDRRMPSLTTAARGLGAPFYRTTDLAKGDWSGDTTVPAIENAFLRVNGRALDVTIGVQPLRWGPGYLGGMLLSDATASLPQVTLSKEFHLPGTVGRHLGPLAFTQIYGQFFEKDDLTAPANARGTRRHFGARRLETAGDGRFRLSLGEAFKAARLPGGVASQVLPYYLYQNDWTKSSRRRLLGFLAGDAEANTNWFNYFADIALSYRADSRGTILYVDYALDDIRAPFSLGNPDNTTTPRKMGQLYGVYLPDVGGLGRYGLRLEYAASDRETYTNLSAPIAWTRDNRPLGFPGGPNARLLFGRIDARLSARVKAAIEGQVRRRGVTDSSAVANEPNANRFGLYGSYDLRRNLFLGARYEYQKTMPQTGATIKQSRFDFNLATGF